jgi:hypothetical protein
VAADVNQSGSISSMDAYYILQQSVGLIELPFPGAGAVWRFTPPTRSYPGLASDQSGQDFVAVLLGDASGNWDAMGSPMAVASAQPPVTIAVIGGTVSPSGLATATVWLDAPQALLYSLDLALAYTSAEVISVRPGPLAGDFLHQANLSESGRVRLAFAGARPITGRGELVELTLRMSPRAAGCAALHLTRGEANEGQLPTRLLDGQIGDCMYCLPLILRSYGVP